MSMRTVVLEPLATVPNGLDLMIINLLRLDERGDSDNGGNSDRGRYVGVIVSITDVFFGAQIW
jgi:hypothetical protein